MSSILTQITFNLAEPLLLMTLRTLAGGNNKITTTISVNCPRNSFTIQVVNVKVFYLLFFFL